MTPTGKPPPLAVRLEKALPFRRGVGGEDVLWGSPASQNTQKPQAQYHGEPRSSGVVPRRLPSLKEECALMHPLQGASFLSTPLQGGILKPPALRVVVDCVVTVQRKGDFRKTPDLPRSGGPGITLSLIPNITENPRNRKTPKRGRKRLFNQAIHALQERVERTFAWEDKFKRLLLRFEYIQQRHYGMKLMAYILINVRRFCRA